jgi:hypothetical protein
LFLLAACSGKSAPTPESAPAPTPSETKSSSPAFPPGDSAFEKWVMVGAPVVHDAATAAPDGSQSADTVDMKINEGLQFVTKKPVAAGETRTSKIYLWGTPGKLVALQLVGCSPVAADIETVNVELTGQPQEYSVSRQFAAKHDCTFFQFIMQSPKGGSVNTWGARQE